MYRHLLGVACSYVVLGMGHDVTTGSFPFNIKAMPFIKLLCLVIDFEYLQSDMPGLLLTRRNNRFNQLAPDTPALVMRMNNEHSYVQLGVSIFDMGIPHQLTLFVHHYNGVWVKMSGKIVFLPLLIPTPYFGNITLHYQAIQFEDRFSVCLFGFSVSVNHADGLSA